VNRESRRTIHDPRFTIHDPTVECRDDTGYGTRRTMSNQEAAS
jgi:hypothetical protein